MIITIADIAIFILLIAMTLIGASNMKARSKVIFIIIGVIAIVLYAFVACSSYKTKAESDKKLDDTNKQLTSTRSQLDNTNKKLDEILIIVKRNNPELEGLDNVDSIIDAYQKLELRTSSLEKETQKTVFTAVNKTVVLLPDGTYESRFDLVPIGKNIIPLFKVECETKNDAKIISLKIRSKTTNLDGMWLVNSSEDGTYRNETIKNIEPGVINVTVLTDKKPIINCDYMPKESKEN